MAFSKKGDSQWIINKAAPESVEEKATKKVKCSATAAARGNPGPSASGYVVPDMDDKNPGHRQLLPA